MKTIPEIKSIRKQYKETNYSAIYGVYPKRLSRELGISRNKDKELLDAYW
jgi:DNA polymerase I-like protein with 3'-5' exonuclease and polymerase domains